MADTQPQHAESVATYVVSLHLRVEAASAKEAVAMVEYDVRRHLYTWPVEMGAATRLIDGSGGVGAQGDDPDAPLVKDALRPTHRDGSQT